MHVDETNHKPPRIKAGFGPGLLSMGDVDGGQGSCEAYLRRHHISLYINDLVGQVVQSPRTDVVNFVEEYFSNAVRGEHVLGREFEFMAATPHNRLSFLVQAKELLHNVEEAGPTTIADCHSLLRMLCPDFPLGAVKNAWNTALAIYTEAHLGSKAASAKKEAMCMPFSSFFTSLEVTFTYERFLMDLRKKHFDSSKHCISYEELYQTIKQAHKWAEASGWPVPCPDAAEKSLSEASKGGENRTFEFRNLVKSLSCCEDVQKSLKEKRQQLEVVRGSCYLPIENAVQAPKAPIPDCPEKGCETPKGRKRSARSKGH